MRGIDAASSKLIPNGTHMAPLAGKRTYVAKVSQDAVITLSPTLISVTADPTRVTIPEASTPSLFSARLPSATRTSLKLRPTAFTSISIQSSGSGVWYISSSSHWKVSSRPGVLIVSLRGRPQPMNGTISGSPLASYLRNDPSTSRVRSTRGT